MKTILLLTYKISPYKGSEYSVSWNYVMNMRNSCKLIVVYGDEKNDIESFLKETSMPNVEFVNIPVKPIFSKGIKLEIEYNRNYRQWHKTAFNKIKEIIRNEGIDVVHYLNPIGFKEPSYCYKLQGIPYVWGPVQGVENRPFCLYRVLGYKGVIDAVARLIFHNGLFRYGNRVKKAFARADYIFAATPNTKTQIEKYHHKDSFYLPENGIIKMNRTQPVSYHNGEELQLIWIGEINFRKALIILLDALRRTKNRTWCLNIVGDGCLSSKLKETALRFGISANIKWYGKMTRKDVFDKLKSSHLHVITSTGEATTTVLWEAMSWAVPTMTLDHCGMSGVVCEKCGIKIPIRSYHQIVTDISKSIDNIILNPEVITTLSSGVLDCSKKFMWENRIKIFNNAYGEIINKYDKRK